MNSESLVTCFDRNHQYLEKFEENKTKLGAPENFTIVPFSDHSLLTLKGLNLPIKLILQRF